MTDPLAESIQKCLQSASQGRISLTDLENDSARLATQIRVAITQGCGQREHVERITREAEVREQQRVDAVHEPYRGVGFLGCTLAGPGRGDCAHFDPEGPRGPTDSDGRPFKWCWSCWKDYRLEQAEKRLKQGWSFLERLGRTAYGYDVT